MYLETIMTWKRQELPKQKRERPVSDLRAQAALMVKPLDFAAALRRRSGPPRLIAEIKRASPSKGLLRHGFDPATLAKDYVNNGASAISVLTDKKFFQGNIEHLMAAKATAKIPVLRKDFIFDPYQIVEARVAGADALLLIVAVLSDPQISTLLEETERLGMTALVEAHNEDEVGRALKAGAKVIGVNNRDLSDFSVDLETSARLRPLVPPEIVFVSESGIRSAADARRVAKMGVDAILVGEAIVKAKDVGAKVRELAGR